MDRFVESSLGSGTIGEISACFILLGLGYFGEVRCLQVFKDDGFIAANKAIRLFMQEVPSLVTYLPVGLSYESNGLASAIAEALSLMWWFLWSIHGSCLLVAYSKLFSSLSCPLLLVHGFSPFFFFLETDC